MYFKERQKWEVHTASNVFSFTATVLVLSFLIACIGATNLDEELLITYDQKLAIDKVSFSVILSEI